MTMETLYIALIGLAAGLALGGGIGVWYGRRRVETTSVASIQKENEEFRDQVTDHFVETAQLINQMTDSYKAVFDHLSGGAEKLVDQKKLAERLPEITQREVRLKRIGAKQPGSQAAANLPKKPPQSGQPSSQGKAPTTKK